MTINSLTEQLYANVRLRIQQPTPLLLPILKVFSFFFFTHIYFFFKKKNIAQKLLAKATHCSKEPLNLLIKMDQRSKPKALFLAQL